ncbi:hypothetical protein PYCCODRAFT_1440740 [Trametes coccinea BRFM310]|uniref:Uncharacterized protein n=1 Tax=Trametes coccinea (strain BRFM310) TaxID=1353009 RepID=A0A1Y2I6S3_TRAC3|nr:hypothetical protein PYCCODRAFT_1440740 [Trametes coccinea BRFM310]
MSMLLTLAQNRPSAVVSPGAHVRSSQAKLPAHAVRAHASCARNHGQVSAGACGKQWPSRRLSMARRPKEVC